MFEEVIIILCHLVNQTRAVRTVEWTSREVETDHKEDG